MTRKKENLTVVLDVDPASVWLRTTPGALALDQPYYCTEAGHFIAGPRFSTIRSNKDSYLLFYTVSGKGFVEQAGFRVALPAGQALLLDCRIPQQYGTAPGADGWDHYWMHIDGSGVRAACAMMKAAAPLPVIDMNGIALSASFDAVFSWTDADSAEAMIEQGLMIHRILARMLQLQLSAGKGRSQGNRTLIRSAADYIRAHSAAPLSIDDITQQTNMSKSSLMRQFRIYMGTTPYNYLLSCRITEAKELLSLTDLSVAEIAERVGFGDESSFSSRFSAMTGSSPLQYRRSTIRQNEQGKIQGTLPLEKSS